MNGCLGRAAFVLLVTVCAVIVLIDAAVIYLGPH